MKYDVLVWGAGRIGYAAAYDLSKNGFNILVADINKDALKHVEDTLGVDTVLVKPDFSWLSEFRNEADLISSSLPAPVAYKSVEVSLKNGFNVVDATSLTGQDPRPLGDLVKDNFGVLYAGVAPGMVHVLSGAIYRELGGLDKLEIICGGMPKDPEGKVLKTNITWSPIGFLGMYNRKSRKVVDGKIVYADPLEDIGTLIFPGEGEYEYFLSDGLRSLLFNFSDVPNMAEYSPRWKGHIEQMRWLRELGLISKDPIKVKDCEVSPIEMVAEIINKKLTDDPRDKVLTLVRGVKENKFLEYRNVTYYDEETGITAMQRTTGFNLSRFTMIALNGDLVRDKGLNYPEEFGLDKTLFKKYINQMKKVNVEFIKNQGMIS